MLAELRAKMYELTPLRIWQALITGFRRLLAPGRPATRPASPGRLPIAKHTVQAKEPFRRIE